MNISTKVEAEAYRTMYNIFTIYNSELNFIPGIETKFTYKVKQMKNQ
jgi:hypothetical protein